MYSDENKSSVLAKLINGFDYVLIDTCSLMDDAFPEWMDALHGAKAYRKKGLEILVPRQCYDELKKHARQKDNDSKRIDAKRGLKILRRAKWSKLLTVTKKDKNENFADNWIYVKVSTDRLFSKILIITQDKSLAYDLRALNQLKSQNGRPIEVCKIVTGGRLVPNFGEQNPRKEYRGNGPLVKDSPKPNPKGKPQEPNPAEAVLLADARLSAVINNSNYPEEKKRADAIAQIKAIEKLPESTRSRLNLLVPMPRLQELAKPAKKQPEPKKEAPKPEPKKEAPKPEPKKEEPKKADTAEPSKERLWYGTGSTMAEGFKDCGAHYGIVFHEPSVIYFKDAHGPLDLSTKDLENIEALGMSLLKGEDKISFLYRGMTLLTQKCPGKYKCWIDVNLLPKALLPISKTDRPKTETKALPAPVEEPPVEEKPAAPEKPKAKKASAKKAEKPVKEEPKAATETTPKAEKPAPKKKATPKAKAEKPVTEEATKKEEKPAAKKPAKSSKSSQKPAENKEKAEAKAEEKPAEPKPKAPRKKKAAAPKTEAVDEEAFKKIAAADRRLQAVLPNPNYPMESKIADLKAQRDLLANLPEDKLATLKYGPREIEEWLNANA